MLGLRKDALIHALKTQLKDQNETKVDKQVLKGLTIGYFTATEDRKADVQRLLARILDFNAEEMDRAGVRIGRKRETESLSHKFVQFLQNESKVVESSVARDLSRSLINPFVTSSPLSSNQLLSAETPVLVSMPSMHSRDD